MSEFRNASVPTEEEKAWSERSPPGTKTPSELEEQALSSSKSNTEANVDPGPPPNGGFTAWLHVLCSFMLFFNTWGILNAFGVYQTYYESGMLFTASSADISWIGSIAAFMLLLMGIFAGPLYDRGYLKALLLVGGFLIVFGHMMLSLCQTYWQVVLAQALTIGTGMGMLFIPCVAILAQYFNTRIGTAVGLAASGSGLGGVIYPIIVYRLIDQIGFAWAVRVEGFVALATLVVPLSFMKLRVKPAKPRAILDLTAFTDMPYMWFVLTTLISFLGIIVVIFYLSFYAEATHIVSTELAFYLVPIFNAGSCFGRTIPNAIGDLTGPFNVIAPGCFIAGVLMLVTIAVHTEAGIIVIAVVTGFVAGVLVGMPPVCFVAIVKDKSKLGTRIGMGYAMIGLGILAAGPSAGAIAGKMPPSNISGMWTLGGVACCVGGLMYFAQRVSIAGFGLKRA